MGLNSYMSIAFLLLFTLIWAGFFACFRLKKKDFAYFLFFTIFYIYVYKVLDYTLFQFQSLVLLKRFMPGLMLNGLSPDKSVNLIPLITLTLEDVKTSLLNILLMIPFGFGLPFITGVRMKGAVLAGAFFSVAIELLQFITGFIGKISFRIADINDVVFNTLGAAIGYASFVAFMHFFFRLSPKWKISAHPVLQHIAERPQADKQPDINRQ